AAPRRPRPERAPPTEHPRPDLAPGADPPRLAPPGAPPWGARSGGGGSLRDPVRPGPRGRSPRTSMPVNPQVDSPLSIGYLSPGWPRDEFPNGVVSYIADMVEPLRRMGHRVTVVVSQDNRPEAEPASYELEWARSSQGLVRRLRNWLGYRLAPGETQRRVFRSLLLAAIDRAIAERGVQLFEIEETLGHALWI